MELRNPNGFQVYFLIYSINKIPCEQVCCLGRNCSSDANWVPATISNKDGLMLTVTAPDSCLKKHLVGLRYLWHETPCPFKQATLYSGTDSNLPSPPYIKLF